MEEQKLLDDITEFLIIPQFERILYHKVQEMKIFLKDEIAFYRNLRKKFRDEAYGKMEVYNSAEQESVKKERSYLFQLDLEEDNKWALSNIEPSLPPGCNRDQLLPRAIIQYITSFRTAPAKIEEFNDFSLSSLKGRRFDFKFAKYSDSHILGTISNVNFESIHKASEPGENNLVDINEHFEKETTERKYREMTDYMKTHSEFEEHMLAEFYMKWKPLIDKKLL